MNAVFILHAIFICVPFMGLSSAQLRPSNCADWRSAIYGLDIARHCRIMVFVIIQFADPYCLLQKRIALLEVRCQRSEV